MTSLLNKLSETSKISYYCTLSDFNLSQKTIGLIDNVPGMYKMSAQTMVSVSLARMSGNYSLVFHPVINH